MYEATRALKAQSTVSKLWTRPAKWLAPRVGPGTNAGRTRPLPVAGRRPSRMGRPSGLIVAEHDQDIGLRHTSARQSADGLGRPAAALRSQHPTGAVTIPHDCPEADVRYTARTPTHGHLREVFVDAIRPLM
jgi:hypothetical protein